MAELIAARRGLSPAAGWVPPHHDTETDMNGKAHDQARAREHRAEESRR
jgi:hypothetical protein